MQVARILRVGGDQNDHEVIEAALRGVGQTDLTFADHATAKDLITERRVDLVMLDLMQNSAHIFDLLKAAGPSPGKTSRVPVIVTGPTSVPDRIQACLQRGAEDYLTTPLDASNALLITRRIELSLQRRSLREFTVKLRSAPPDTAAQLQQLYSDSSSRFVPREFLDQLQRATLDDVKLGDHVLREMSVLFSDIRDFTALSENLTPQQNFDFLNSYLRQVTPIIRANRGFIDKYMGDGIMALFARQPADALTTAVEMQKQMVRYNLGRKAAGYVPIRIGIGLHRGDLILGTIGEEERIQTTVISDAVNVASRIEGLTKTLHCDILVSGDIVSGLADPKMFRLRHLGAVRAKGKTQSVEMYECFENDDDELIVHKEKTAEIFAAGMNEFRKGMLISAGRIFARLSEMNRHDAPAAYYRDACSRAIVRDRKLGPWDGSEIIEVK